MEKGLKAGATVSSSIPKRGEIGSITVEGYDIDLSQEEVESAVRKHFSSCGEITDVCVPKTPEGDALMWVGFVYFRGQEAVDKSLKLDGSDVGGWKVGVEAHPFPSWNGASFFVRIIHDSLLDEDIKSTLVNHFAPYGKFRVDVHRVQAERGALVKITGKDAPEKALQHCEIDMAGSKAVAKLISVPGFSAVHSRPRYRRSRFSVRKMRDSHYDLVKTKGQVRRPRRKRNREVSGK